AALGCAVGRGLEARVLVGPANQHGAALAVAARQARGAIELLPPSSDVAGLMAWADVAVAAAGTTAWELAFMGLPSLLIRVADNQIGTATGLDERGIAVDLGDAERLESKQIAASLADLASDPLRRRSMAGRGRHLID